MGERARLAGGAVVTFAIAAVVVGAVALTNSAALADAPGTVTGHGAVTVAAATPSTVPSEPEATPAAPEDIDPEPTPERGEAETVPAPDPEVVVTEPDPQAGPAEREDDSAHESGRSGRLWARENGWSRADLEAWLTRLAESRAARDGERQSDDGRDDDQAGSDEQRRSDADDDAGETDGDGSERGGRGADSDEERSHGSPDRDD